MASVNIRVQKHRNHLRASGLRPLQLWVPDTRQQGFAEECRRQSTLIQGDPHEHEMLNYIASISDDQGWI